LLHVYVFYITPTTVPVLHTSFLKTDCIKIHKTAYIIKKL